MKWKYGMLTLLGLLLFGGVWGQVCTSSISCVTSPSISASNNFSTKYCPEDIVRIDGADMCGYTTVSLGAAATVVPIVNHECGFIEFEIPSGFPQGNHELFLDLSTTSETIKVQPAGTISYPSNPLCELSLFSGNPSVTPNGGTFSSTTAQVDINTGVIDIQNTTNTGVHVIEYSKGKCSAFQTINILPANTPQANYLTHEFCIDDPSPASPTILPPASSGTFSCATCSPSFPPNGTFVPTQHPIGEHEIIFSTGAFCEIAWVDTLVIYALDSAEFDFPDTVCSSHPPFPPIVTGLSNGAFTQTAEAPINIQSNFQNGVLFPALSDAGTYEFTYFVNERCANSSIDTITIVSDTLTQFEIENDSICSNGDSLTFCLATIPSRIIIPGLGIDTVYMSANSGANCSLGYVGSVGLNVPGNTPGNYVIRCIARGVPCADTAYRALYLAPPPNLDIEYPATVCNNVPILPVNLVAGPSGGVFSVDNPNFVLDAQGNLLPDQGPPGAVTIKYTVNPGTPCEATDSALVIVQSVTDATFSLGADSLCQGQTSPDAIPVVQGGTFSTAQQNAAFISLGSLGAVTAFPNAVGLFDITYTSSGICPDQSTETITILHQPNATFTYSLPQYCLQGADPNPDEAFDTGGFYYTLDSTCQATGCVNPLTGTLNLNAVYNAGFTPAQNGPLTVYRVIPGFCNDSASTQVSVSAFQVANIFYEDVEYCTSDDTINLDPSVVLQSSGRFSTSDPSVVIDSMLGTIFPSQSNFVGPLTVYYNTTVGGGQCNSVDSVILELLPPANVLLDYPDTIICTNKGRFKPTFDKDGSTAFYQWTSIPNVNIGSQEGTIDPFDMPSQTVYVTVTFSSACQETVSDSFQVQIPSDSIFQFSQPEFCPDDDSLFSILPDSGGVFTSLPSMGGGIVDSLNGIFDLSQVAPGRYQIYYEFREGCGGLWSEQLVVSGPSTPPVIALDPGPFVCNNEQFILETNGPGSPRLLVDNDTIPWTNPSLFSYRLDSIQESTEFTVVWDYGLGCTDTLREIVYTTNYPSIQDNIYDPFNQTGTPVLIGVTLSDSPAELHWEICSRKEIEFNGDTSGTATSSQPNEILQILLEDYELTDQLSPGIIELCFTPYNFTPMGDTCHGPPEILKLDILQLDSNIYVPEVITPNGDMVNDNWNIIWKPGKINPLDYSILLYNRSGGLVYEMVGLTQDWLGDSLPDGVYWWLLKNNTTNQTIQTGGLTIIRKENIFGSN